MNAFYFGNMNSAQYGVWISGSGTYNAPERDVEYIEIPGRSGDLIVDNGRWKDIIVTYPAFIPRHFPERWDAFKAAMLSHRGYHRLMDDYSLDYYRMAAFAGPINVNTGPRNFSGNFSLQFKCKPQRFLRAGEEALIFFSSGTLINPTLFTAFPLITLTGEGPGELIVNGHIIQISEVGGSVTLNREIRRAYAGTIRRDYTMTGRFDWLGLVPGENTISFNGGITAVSIIPRWWTV